jgi:TRAP-type C4-dicarboxylate transport system substrate-binding protein
MARALHFAAWTLACALVVVPSERTRAQDDAEPPATGRVLSIATLAPPGSAMVRGLEAWNRELRRRSGGALSLRLYTGGVQGDDPEVVRKIRSGRLDGGTITATGLASIHRPALVFQLPGLFQTYEQLDAARAALGPEIDRGIESAGFHMLGWADVGHARLFSTEPARAPADLRGRHVWVRDDDLVLPSFATRSGAIPVELGVPEVLGALSTHRVDTFLAPPLVALALQWTSHVRYVNEIPMSIVVGGTVMSHEAYAALPDDQRALLDETGAQFHLLGRRASRRHEREGIDALADHGITVVETNYAAIEGWRDLGRALRADVAAQIASPDLVARAAAFGER